MKKEKFCKKCKTEKNRDEFGNRSDRSDGKNPFCKPCAAASSKKSLMKKRDKENAQKPEVVPQSANGSQIKIGSVEYKILRGFVFHFINGEWRRSQKQASEILEAIEDQKLLIIKSYTQIRSLNF